MNQNKSKERNCEICNIIFYVQFPSIKVRTCSNQECRKKIRSITTTNYFKNNPQAKEELSIKSKNLWNNEDYKKKTMEGLSNRDYKKENHPSWGMKRTDEQKNNISKGQLKNKESEDIDKIVKIIKDNYEKFKNELFTKTEKNSLPPTKYTLEKRKLIQELKDEKGNVCIDCGCSDFLEFDHIDNKIKCVSSMPNNKMREEAAKCVLRCKICHIIKSHNENYKSTQNIPTIDTERNIQNRNLRKRRREYISNIKKSIGGCQCCNYKNDEAPYVFDFDHIDSETKYKGISWLVSHGSSIKKINEELVKCILLCRKCHAKRTSVQFDLVL